MKTTLTSNLKPVGSVTLMLILGVASVYGQSVKMAFSGTASNSVINLQQPNTSGDEDTLAGTGNLGSFTLRNVRAISNSPSSSSSCSGADDLYLLESPGAGVFRFQDGSLMYVQITQGSDCINVVTGVAHCVLTLQVNGGTSRFKNASGALTFTETVVTVTSDALGNPVYFGATGAITGTVLGVGGEQDQGEDQ